MRWTLCLLFLTLLLGCSSKEEPKKLGSEEDISAGFVDPSGGKGKEASAPQTQETEERNKPTYPVKQFLACLKQGKAEKSLEFLTSESRSIFSATRLPRIERYYVLDVLKKDERTIVNSEMRFIFKDTTYRDIRMGWLVQEEGGQWKIYGSETEGFYCFYNTHSPQKAESLALSVLRSLRKKAYYYRLRRGKFVDINQMVEENFLPKDLKDGNFKEYTYSLELGNSSISILAIPKVIMPIHRGFYLDSANILRYSQDGSIPTGSSGPVIFKQEKPKKKKKRREE